MALPYLSSGGSGGSRTTVSQPSTKLSAAGQAVSKAYEAEKATNMKAQAAQSSTDAINYNRSITTGLQKTPGMVDYGGGVKFGGISSKQSSYSNGNPILRGGRAKMSIMGQEFDVPQAFVQQGMYTADWNQGRYTPMEGLSNYITEQQNKGSTYMDFSGLNAMTDKFFRQNPALEEDRPLSRRESVKEQMGEMGQRVAQIEQQGRNRTETANPFGITNDHGWGAMEREMSQLKQSINRIGNDLTYMRGTGGMERLSGELNIQGYRPTTSNLPISERWDLK